MNYLYLLDESGKCIAAGSFEDPKPHLYNRFEREIMNSINENIKEEMDREILRLL